jgi:predicted Zn finger-like uncharacterized protein
MLISCPKCHSIYEVPDNLIPKTGQNFRCQACSNVWNAIPSDALGYEENEESEPFVEAIEVSEPPHRNYPANKENYQIVNDTKSGKRTMSSKELVNEEGDPNYKAPKPKKKKELTLTSDMGTSFTICMDGKEEQENDEQPRLSAFDDELKVKSSDRLVDEKPKKWYVKTKFFIFLLFVVAFLYFLRGLIVMVYPNAESYYNKIGLSGLYNVSNLQFNGVEVSEQEIDGKNMIKLKVGVKNNGMLGTKLPKIKVEGFDDSFGGETMFLKAKEKTEVEILLPNKGLSNFNIRFVR